MYRYTHTHTHAHIHITYADARIPCAIGRRVICRTKSWKQSKLKITNDPLVFQKFSNHTTIL